MKAFIRVTGVSKTFALAKHGGGHASLFEALRAGRREVVHREVRALDDVSFAVRAGERVGIIGRNGAGKTTLLSLLAGITQPTAGSIGIEGDVHAMLTIGAVLRAEATGRENIFLDGAVHGHSREHMEALAQRMIDFAELGEFIDRPVHTYSSGMKGRLAFALGAYTETDILIIDETLSVGDAIFARKATKRMKELTQAGQIVIVVSHGLSTIVDICNRCLWLDKGRLVMDGPPAEVTKAYSAAVDAADETELARKFNRLDEGAARIEAGRIDSVALGQMGGDAAGSVKAHEPLDIVVRGQLVRPEGRADLELRLLRVDGKPIWRERLSQNGGVVPPGGPFTVKVRMEPMILGANLYRLDALLLDDAGVAAANSRVFEVVDDDPPAGGKPMLYYEPQITVRES